MTGRLSPTPSCLARCSTTSYDLEHSDLGFDAIFGSGCPYCLGRGIFRELYNRLGDEASRQGFGRLYLALRDDSHEEVCGGDDRNGCYVREAFTEGADSRAGGYRGGDSGAEVLRLFLRSRGPTRDGPILSSIGLRLLDDAE